MKWLEGRVRGKKGPVRNRPERRMEKVDGFLGRPFFLCSEGKLGVVFYSGGMSGALAGGANAPHSRWQKQEKPFRMTKRKLFGNKPDD